MVAREAQGQDREERWEGKGTDGPVVGDIERFLCEMLQRLEPDPAEAERRGPGRPRVLPALCLWGGLLVCVLRGLRSQVEIWRLLSQRGLWFYPRFPVTDQAIYTRLEKAGTAPLEQLFGQVSTVLAERLAPYAASDLAPFAQAVVALDETTLDQVARLLPALREFPRGDARLLGGKLAGRFDLRRQQWQHLQYVAEPLQNSRVAARQLLQGLAPGSLVLADLGYFGFEWFDDLTQGGYWWISRIKTNTTYTLLHRYYARGETLDAVVFLGNHAAHRARHAVRLVQFRVGPTLYTYLTNVLDPRVLSLGEIARLYARRWDIELAVKLVKRELGLHLLWSAKPGVIQQQLWAVLILAQILQALRLEVAGRAGVDVFEVSLPLLVRYLPQFAYEGLDPVTAFVEYGRGMRLIRPSRRLQRQAPTIEPEDLVPLPPDLVLQREPRYGRPKHTPHPSRN